MNMRPAHLVVLASLFACAGTALAQHHHEGDLVVGRTSAGQLRIEFDFDEPIALPPVDGLLKGWARDDPGFDHLEADEPDEDFLMLGSGAHIRFDVVSFAPAFQAWTPGFAAALRNPGDSYVFPDGELLHGHLNWHIDALDPRFEPTAGPWTASFRLIDVGTTGYSPSDVYTFMFAPEPSAVALVALGALLVRRRA